MNRARSAALGALALAAACRTSEPAPKAAGPTAQAPGEQGPALERAPGATDDGGRLQLPERASGKLPLLVFLHGLGGSGGELAEGLGLAELSESLGFGYIAPDGVLDHSGRRFWNATESCCNFDGLAVDHVQLLRRWITQATANPRVDPGRVYIVGFSNGGFMAYRAACELGPLLRGIVSIAGAGSSGAAACRPNAKLSVVQIHGDRDPIVSFEGGYLFGDGQRPAHPSAEASVAAWAELDGCSGSAQPTRELDLDPRVPGAETQVVSYSGCGERRVELWRIPGGDHFAGLSRRSARAIWDFISADSASPQPAGGAPSR
ncbi:MAG TPA: PHB depolymerase family esterase [Polyangiaceae bacterium]|nr:PHB depolymerase family esterase [Polyangiaceae bacterium]